MALDFPWLELYILVVIVYDAGQWADAGHRADDRVFIVRTGLRPG